MNSNLGSARKVVGELLVRGRDEAGVLPEIGREVSVQLPDAEEGGLHEVTESLRGATRRGVTVLDTGVLENLLRHVSSDNAGTLGRRDETHANGTALGRNLDRDGVRSSDLVTPVSTTDRDDGHLGGDDGAADGGRHLLGSLHAETKVALVVTDDHESLEAGALTSTGLLLHGHDLHHLVLELLAKEKVKDLVLLDGDGEQEDLLELLNLAILDETSELGDGHPLLLVGALLATLLATLLALALALAKALAEAATLFTLTFTHAGSEYSTQRVS